jgi:pimeloyl-ACP methyl ester carboxylesterase
MKHAIIIVGGYGSLWTAYLRMARYLEDMTSLQTVGVPLAPWDWWKAGRLEDATGILQRLAETVAWARRKFRAERFVLVGHSAGGLIGRLYLSEQPVWGRTYSGWEHVSAVITLGSPHCAAGGTYGGWFLSDEANRLAPGAPYAGRIRYRAVAGRCLLGQERGSYAERRAFRAYQFFDGQGDTWGDGIVPTQCSCLDGAETLVLDGVAHSARISGDWYGGSRAIVRRWWPREAGDGR